MLIMKNLYSIARNFAAIALLSVAVVGCASTANKEGTGEYIDDSVVTTKVMSAIFADPDLKSAEINVETFKGVVQLSGFVSKEANISKAGAVAAGVEGVTSVKNNLHLK
jgi:osmotically-inducible protein OsmY